MKEDNDLVPMDLFITTEEKDAYIEATQVEGYSSIDELVENTLIKQLEEDKANNLHLRPHNYRPAPPSGPIKLTVWIRRSVADELNDFVKELNRNLRRQRENR